MFIENSMFAMQFLPYTLWQEFTYTLAAPAMVGKENGFADQLRKYMQNLDLPCVAIDMQHNFTTASLRNLGTEKCGPSP